VDGDVGNATGGSMFCKRNQVILVAVNASIGHKPDEVEPAAARFRERLIDHLVVGQLAIGDRFVDAGQVLVNDPASAKVEVSNLRIAHLALWQTDVHPRGTQAASRVGFIQVIMEGRPGKQRCIPVSFGSLSPVGIDSPPVPDNQNNWLRHTAQIRRKYPASNDHLAPVIFLPAAPASALSAAFFRRM
jgi:hypothetical protein